MPRAPPIPLTEGTDARVNPWAAGITSGSSPAPFPPFQQPSVPQMSHRRRLRNFKKRQNSFKNEAPPDFPRPHAPLASRDWVGPPGRPGSWKKRKRGARKQHPSSDGLLEDGEFRPPRLQDLKKKNRVKTRAFFGNRKPDSVPQAPRNTTSFIMLSNKMGLNAPISSPAQALVRTPQNGAVPSFVDTPGENNLGADASELHVNPYGSMNGCIRLKSPSVSDREESDGTVDKVISSGGDSEATSTSESSEANQTKRQRRDDARAVQSFGVLFNVEGTPGSQVGDEFLRARVDEQETRINHLEEENLLLRERLYVAEQEIKELRRRLGEGLDDMLEAGADNSDDEGSCAAHMS